MILPIYLYGHPVLERRLKDIEPDYPELKKLIEDMFETMYHSRSWPCGSTDWIAYQRDRYRRQCARREFPGMQRPEVRPHKS